MVKLSKVQIIGRMRAPLSVTRSVEKRTFYFSPSKLSFALGKKGALTNKLGQHQGLESRNKLTITLACSVITAILIVLFKMLHFESPTEMYPKRGFPIMLKRMGFQFVRQVSPMFSAPMLFPGPPR